MTILVGEEWTSQTLDGMQCAGRSTYLAVRWEVNVPLTAVPLCSSAPLEELQTAISTQIWWHMYNMEKQSGVNPVTAQGWSHT